MIVLNSFRFTHGVLGSTVDSAAVYTHNGSYYSPVADVSTLMTKSSWTRTSGTADPLTSGTLTLDSGIGPATIAFTSVLYFD